MEENNVIPFVLIVLALNVGVFFLIIKFAVKSAVSDMRQDIETLVNLKVLELKKTMPVSEVSEGLKKAQIERLRKSLNAGTIAKVEYDLKVQELNKRYDFQ